MAASYMPSSLIRPALGLVCGRPLAPTGRPTPWSFRLHWCGPSQGRPCCWCRFDRTATQSSGGRTAVAWMIGFLEIGVWRSLVAHLLWEQGAGGSNPLTPTITYRAAPTSAEVLVPSLRRSRPSSGARCAYRIVIWMSECPSSSFTSRSDRPCWTSQDAVVCGLQVLGHARELVGGLLVRLQRIPKLSDAGLITIMFMAAVENGPVLRSSYNISWRITRPPGSSFSKLSA